MRGSLIRQNSDILQYPVETLEQGCSFENAIATSLRCFDLIVQAFHKAAVKTATKIVDDLIKSIIEDCQGLVKAS